MVLNGEIHIYFVSVALGIMHNISGCKTENNGLRCHHTTNEGVREKKALGIYISMRKYFCSHLPKFISTYYYHNQGKRYLFSLQQRI